jgi:universal stress protein A
MQDMKIRKILVPTDFSDAAGGALRTAMGMARTFQASIGLFHVTATVAMIPDLSQRVQEHLDEEAKRVRAEGITCETGFAEGTPHTEIVRRAQDLGVDLIVMGTHGHGGLTHAVLGSVTERVLHRAHCPVLVVPVRPAS